MSRQYTCTLGTSMLANRDDRPWSGRGLPHTADPLLDVVDFERWRGSDAIAETSTLRAPDLADAGTLALLPSIARLIGVRERKAEGDT